MAMTEIATGLKFPEGPVAMDDGSIILVEIAGGAITRIKKDGKKQAVAKPGGGPNGLAVGPDGALYVCNNGGSFSYTKQQGLMIPGHAPEDHKGGRIERVNISTGKVEVLYDKCDGQKLVGPNDLVFDNAGGFWFTDYGMTTRSLRTHGALYYAKADGSQITQVLRELISPNGVGLSPDGKTVYYAETFTGRLWSLPLTKPGKGAKVPGFTPGVFVGAYPGIAYFDSLGVQADGGICVATILAGGITTFWPGTKKVKHTPLPDPLVTNICWGGKNMKTAYITSSGTGRLLAMDWPKAGLRLNYNA
ncbi:MAG TPA: SMP-30/gluconolactonase/LRE family protein [Rhizomicrobium sp.]|jgi:gluconolactonase|nr:SMP-30/gluconolactonase/LRE family protein [Rhizomicrobium sp.]